MQKHILHFFLLSLVLWSCASAPATRHIQSVDLPTQWHEAHLDSTDSQEAWWVSFYNDELGNLISRSLEGNFDLRVAAGRLDEAMGLAKIAGADLLPSAQVSGTAIRQRQNFVGLPIPGSEGGVITSHSSTFSTSLDLSWELDLWGRIRSGKSAALADVSAAYADFEGAKLSLTGRVAQAWFSYLEARDQVELSQATVQSYQNTLDQVEQRFRLGLRGSLDVRLARSNLESARAGLASREQLLGATTRQLEALLGQYPSGTYA
ncbi:MAG: TolC family protein, partial [Candidatus Eisenbacteria bacterium]|nr:TolC family protein [Candidatus Eisenbacteria bacterium]